jgi:hypothetical protein
VRAALFIFFPVLAWSQLEIRPVNDRTYRAGDIAEVNLYLTNQDDFEWLTPLKLQSSSIEKALWFRRVDVWKLADNSLMTTASVVLGPQLNPEAPGTLSLSDKQIEVRFVGWQFDPSHEKESLPLEYEQVEFFSRAWWRKHASIIVVALIAAGSLLGIFLPRYFRRKKRRSQWISVRKTWVANFDSANDLPSLSRLWMQRDQLITDWSDKTAEIQVFFQALNRYQFQPSVTENEMKQVLNHKQELISALRGSVDGT